MLAEVIRPVYASGECEIDLARRELRILGGVGALGRSGDGRKVIPLWF
jgi:hypothetical protein